MKSHRRLVAGMILGGEPEVGPVGPVVGEDGSGAVLVGPDDQAVAHLPVIPDPSGERIAGGFFVGHFDLALGPGVHRSGEAGVRLSVHQHPNDPHGGIQLHLHRLRRAQPPGGLHFAQHMGARYRSGPG